LAGADMSTPEREFYTISARQAARASSSISTMNPAAKRWWRRPVWLILFAVVTILALGVVGSKLASSRGLNRQLEAVRARGLPTTPVELDAWYEQVPASENIALAILEAHSKYVRPAEDRDPSMMYSWRDIRRSERLPPLLAATAADYVGKNTETIELLQAAVSRKRSRYPVDLSQTTRVFNTALAPVKGMAQLLRWDALLKAEKGDAEGARASIRAGFAIVASLKDEPVLISMLVRMACALIQVEAVEQAVNRVQFSEAALAEIAALAQQAEEDGKQALYRAMVGERVVGIDYFKHVTFDAYEQIAEIGGAVPGYDNLPVILREVLFHLRRGTGMHESDLAFFVENIGKVVRATELDYPEMLPAAKNTFATIEAELDSHPIRLALSFLTLSALERTPQKAATLASKLRCLRAALAVYRFRTENGGKIPSVDEVVPKYIAEWPLDAVDNAPLKIEKYGESGARVIALASTELANEGRAANSTNLQDIAFTFER
jgi:hypothetical protein